jgi:hypothetical protein
VTSSQTLQKPHEFEPAPHLIPAAVGTVAERSFFAFVCDGEDPEYYDSVPEWFIASIKFDDGPVAGEMVCTLPCDLALLLYDAFSGRDPATALPPRHEVDDLVGEFTNMVCGTWLTRCATDRAFRLSRPVVTRVREPEDNPGSRQWLFVNERPLAIDWDVDEHANPGNAHPASL